MNRKLFSFIAAAALALIPFTAFAQVSPGTSLSGTIDQSLGSKDAQVGQQFTMSNVSSTDQSIQGAKIYGHVSDVQRAGQGRPGKINLAFDRVILRSGASYAITGRATAIDVRTKSNAVNEAAGAVGGMIVGNIIGKSLGTNVGGLLGAAGGYIYAKNAKQNVVVPANSTVTVQVLRARRQAGR